VEQAHACRRELGVVVLPGLRVLEQRGAQLQPGRWRAVRCERRAQRVEAVGHVEEHASSLRSNVRKNVLAE